MKHKKSVLVTIMLLTVILAVVVATGCTRPLDNEKSPLVIATQELDGVFSPFFSTSAYDGQVVGMTQIGMLEFDKEGSLEYGDDSTTVVRYVSEKNVDDRADKYGANFDQDKRYENDYYTTYQLVLKNGIKFSDGVELTYKDVFFNLYLYLDPVYNGSNTLYSTDILGLSAYRTQNTTGQNESVFEGDIQDAARVRVSDFLKYYQTESQPNTTTDKEVLAADLAELKRAFRDEELNSDWAMFASGLEDYKKEFTSVDGKQLVTEVWQAYLVNWGACEVTYDIYGTDPTKYKSIDYGRHTSNIEQIKKDNKKKNAATLEKAIKEYCIDQIYINYFGEGNDPDESMFKVRSKAFISSTATGSNYFTYVSNQIKSAKLVGDKKVPSVSGIQLLHKAANEKFTDNKRFNQEITLDQDHYILEVTIYGVDPKALSNFGFSVAPMHYYSNPDALTNKVENTNAKDSANRYFTSATDGWGACSINDPAKEDHFGFAYASTDYLNKVIKAVNGLPMGAGIYKPSNKNGETDIKKISGLGASVGFYDSNIVYYVRNDYFDTVSSSVHNATIKMLRLAVTNSTRLFDAVKTKTVHYADPSATVATMLELNDTKANKDLKYVTTRTNGYGYIGINAKFVTNIEIRQAIMYAMNTRLVLDYFPTGLAENIYWPMSKVSWAYPEEGNTPYYNSNVNGRFDNTTAVAKIKALREHAGYTTLVKEGNASYYKNETGDTLKYTFTVAGGNTDHPAYLTMQSAATLLNDNGFNIKVVTDPFALRKLSSGGLTVWAAAWGSGIDPDMFQVYHKDSKATSIKAWGYPSILGLNGETPTGSQEEVKLIDKLSEEIDAARKITEQDDRKPIYARALKLIMELAVELPTYQRSNLYVYKSTVIDENSVLSQDECSPYVSPLSNLWAVSFVTKN